MGKKFSTAQVVTASTGRMLLLEIGDLYKILNYMTGDDCYTHTLVRASKVCKPWFIKQFPWIDELKPNEVNVDNWKEWLDEIETEYGKTLMVEPLPEGIWESKNPIDELDEMLNRS